MCWGGGLPLPLAFGWAHSFSKPQFPHVLSNASLIKCKWFLNKFPGLICCDSDNEIKHSFDNWINKINTHSRKDSITRKDSNQIHSNQKHHFWKYEKQKNEEEVDSICLFYWFSFLNTAPPVCSCVIWQRRWDGAQNVWFFVRASWLCFSLYSILPALLHVRSYT